jgi:hypothetical protein
MFEEFEEVVCALQPGERAGIFITPLGFHIAVLHAVIPPGPAPSDLCRQDIQNAFTLQNRHTLYLRGVADLRSRAKDSLDRKAGQRGVRPAGRGDGDWAGRGA